MREAADRAGPKRPCPFSHDGRLRVLASAAPPDIIASFGRKREQKRAREKEEKESASESGPFEFPIAGIKRWLTDYVRSRRL